MNNMSDTTTLHNLRPKINGYPVIMAACHPVCYTVMLLRPLFYDKYVVATWFPGMGDEWCWGKYMQDLETARDVFRLTLERNDLQKP